jgi:hypothetical protein
MLPVKTVGAPGIHGAVVTGIQAEGVGTPNAAAVAAITAGFAGAEHMTKDGTQAMGVLLVILPNGIVAITPVVGSTLSGTGETPNEQVNRAVLQAPEAISTSNANQKLTLISRNPAISTRYKSFSTTHWGVSRISITSAICVALLIIALKYPENTPGKYSFGSKLSIISLTSAMIIAAFKTSPSARTC